MQHATVAQTASVYHPSEIIYLYQDNLNWINETRTRNVFAGGFLRETYRDSWDGHVFGDWADSSFTAYAYFNGKLARETTYVVGEAGWTEDTRTTYSYQDDVYSEIVTERYQDGAWGFEERTVFAGEQGVIVSGLTGVWSGAGWEPSEQFTLVEEPDPVTGSNVVETYQTWTGTAWENTERRVYPSQTIASLYDEMQRMLQDITDYEGMYYALRFPSTLQQEWDGEAWVNTSRMTRNRYYDLFTGQILQETMTTDEWTDGAWVATSRIDIEYVEPSSEIAGAPRRTAIQVYDGEAWADVYVESYIIQNNIRRVVQATLAADFGEGLQEMYRVRIDWIDVAVSNEDPDEVPSRFALHQNTPNPFNPATRIAFRLAEPQHIRLAVYDLLGREVAVLVDGFHAAGDHSARWDASGQPSGLYIYRLEAGAHAEARQMVLLK